MTMTQKKRPTPKKPRHTTNITKLVMHCQKFIRDQRIDCPEVVHQTDRVIENAYEFIEGICDIVGYHRMEDDE
jgi:hypothetical protein